MNSSILLGILESRKWIVRPSAAERWPRLRQAGRQGNERHSRHESSLPSAEQSAQLSLGLRQDAFLLSGQTSARPVDIEVQHGHRRLKGRCFAPVTRLGGPLQRRSEEHTSELQSRQYLVCRLLLEKKKKKE